VPKHTSHTYEIPKGFRLDKQTLEARNERGEIATVYLYPGDTITVARTEIRTCSRCHGTGEEPDDQD
jgi:DnaJ-class molecular chaperone